MALARVHGLVVSGVTGALVQVEVDVAQGLPSVGVVGLPDASVTEARWRARSAIDSIGADWPNKRITISLSPAEVRKNGAGLDLPIAVGVLLASKQIPGADVESTTFIGELGLDGSVRPTNGALAGALAARAAGLERIIAPLACAEELERLRDIGVHLVRDLRQVIAVIRGQDPGECGERSSPVARAPRVTHPAALDLSEVRGHETARYALEVAAAGSHHFAMIGPPGVGKTLLAARLPGVLPDLDETAALEVAAVHSVAGRPRSAEEFCRPPFADPHHSASVPALLGAVHGSRVVPGAVTLAHRGVLFLDEAPEFARPVLEGLRQPLEAGRVWLSRSAWAGQLPAAFQLILAANPCPCGRRSSASDSCSCTPQALRRYAARLSGPLMDRIDLRVTMQRPSSAELASSTAAESSAHVRSRIEQARERARHRLAGTPWAVNAHVPAAELRRRWRLGPEPAQMLADLERRSAGLRGPDRVLRMAWTVADLSGHDTPTVDDVGRAIGLRGVATGWLG